MKKSFNKFCGQFSHCGKCVLNKYIATQEQCELLYKYYNDDGTGGQYIHIDL